MEARILKVALLAAALCSLGASYRTANFIVTTSSSDAAEQIGRAAEKYRRELAIEWLGEEMPTWSQPCPINAQIGDNLGAGGATSFLFERGEVYGWRMNIQGSLVRILDSVLPHEVTHTVFATHFRQPLPRWADEGACTTVEHSSERGKQQMMLVDFLRTGRGIPFNMMFAMKEYPRDVMPLYSQGYSLARYLIAQGGRRKFLDYLADGLSDENWTRATKQHYGFTSIAMLQTTWNLWVRDGSPAITQPAPALAASLVQASQRKRPEPNLIYRAQNADPQPAATARPVPAKSAYTPDAPTEANNPANDQANALPRPGAPSEAWHATPPADPTQAVAEPARPVAEPAPAAGSTSPDSAASGSTSAVAKENASVASRAHARQVILEWSRDAAAGESASARQSRPSVADMAGQPASLN